MTKFTYILFLSLIFTMFSLDIFASTKECTKQEAIVAEEVIPKISNWIQFKSYYEQYYHCDDGSIAEGFSEVSANLLIHNWNKEAQKLLYLNSSLKEFVIYHIDETLLDTQLKNVKSNLINTCPENLNDFCKKIILNIESYPSYK
ncbi:hypothetical protein [Sulfurimonas sp.]|uniref:hypothetical protein n=1 Tax=Sulfurimonas sp. TaxID=2022749 RepID=UPI002AB037D6|nr:hypothetical protein [Sulfurimonas sp.]